MTVELAPPPNPIVEQAVGKCGEIAALPEVTAKIIELVESPSSTARDMHEVIKTDPALSARVLKVVNSAFYGLPGQVASVDRAIVLLGLTAVKNIAIAASVSRLFKGQQVGAGFSAKDLWRHSVAVGTAGRIIARKIGQTSAADEVFLAGLIHDLGILVERQALPDKLTMVVERCVAGGGTFLELEQEVIGADHQAFGAALTAKWKFPKNLRAVVGLHHCPERLSPELRTFGGMIRVADVMACQYKLGFPLTAAHDELTDEMLGVVGLTQDDVPPLVEQLQSAVDAAEASLGSA